MINCENQTIIIASQIFVWSTLLKYFCLLTTFELCVGFGGRGPISGYTPCCIDRLSSIICKRQKQQNPAIFLYNCMQNSDYAFVQCCQTCFETNPDDSFKLSYQKTSEFLLTNPITAQCDDRRGVDWCEKFMHRKLNWTKPNKPKIDCSNVPIAFRLCRKSCGYCATKEMPAQAVYHYPDAKDAYRCYNPSNGLVASDRKSSTGAYQGFVNRFTRARTAKNTKSTDSIETTTKEYESLERLISTSTEEFFNAKSSSENQRNHSPNDYFVVTDHDYKHYDEQD